MESSDRRYLYQIALWLALATMICNLTEGIIATYFGYRDESLALFGFGADSFIEMISGFGIAHMVLRISRRPNSSRDDFEQIALRITGYGFYTLFVGLLLTSLYNLWIGHEPTTAFSGVIISLISIILMCALIYAKTKVGK